MEDNMQICKNKIDVHAHSIMSDFPDKVFMTYHSPEELLLKYDMLGIEKGMLLPSVCPEGSKFPITTDHTVEIVNKYPERYFFAIGLDPRMVDNSSDADFGKILEFYKSKGAKAVGEMTANLNFDDPLYDNMLAQCAEHDLPVTIHISPAIGYSYGVVDDPGLPRLEKMLKKYPKLKIFGHSQAFWAHMSKNVDREIMKGYPKGKVEKGRLWELFEKYDNIFGDMSAGSGYNAIARDEENGIDFLNAFQDKMLFGCDFCAVTDVRELAGWLDNKYLEGALSEDVYLKICRENAIRILKL